MEAAKLRQQFTIDFISTYKSVPALWNSSSPEYKSRNSKRAAYDVMIAKCQEYAPDSDLDFVKLKIKSVRDSFRKEQRKVEDCKKADKPYTPTLWYYGMMTFLLKDGEEVAATLPLDINSDISNLKNIEHIPEDIPLDEPQMSFFNVPLETTKAEPIDITRNQSNSVEDDANSESVIDDLYNAIARNVAHKLRSMTETQRLYAEKILNDIMYHGQMENLTSSSCLDLGRR